MSQNNNTLPASSALTTLLTTISASVVIPTALVDSSIPTSTTLEIALVLPGSYVLAITKIIPLRVVAKLGAAKVVRIVRHRCHVGWRWKWPAEIWWRWGRNATWECSMLKGRGWRERLYRELSGKLIRHRGWWRVRRCAEGRWRRSLGKVLCSVWRRRRRMVLAIVGHALTAIWSIRAIPLRSRAGRVAAIRSGLWSLLIALLVLVVTATIRRVPALRSWRHATMAMRSGAVLGARVLPTIV
jgi:hypothetical protein